MSPDSMPRPWPSDSVHAPLNAPTVARLEVMLVKHCIGKGIEGDPCRVVDDYFDVDGVFLDRRDPYEDIKP